MRLPKNTLFYILRAEYENILCSLVGIWLSAWLVWYPSCKSSLTWTYTHFPTWKWYNSEKFISDTSDSWSCHCWSLLSFNEHGHRVVMGTDTRKTYFLFLYGMITAIIFPWSCHEILSAIWFSGKINTTYFSISLSWNEPLSIMFSSKNWYSEVSVWARMLQVKKSSSLAVLSPRVLWMYEYSRIDQIE